MIKPEFREMLKKEGDSKEFTYKGYDCSIKRVHPQHSGHLCGYIHIPTGHEFHGMDYDEIETYYQYDLPAHGGLTFASYIEGEYWIGFDCAHAGDILPCEIQGTLTLASFGYEYGSYKDMEYVTNNIKEIIDFMESNRGN